MFPVPSRRAFIALSAAVLTALCAADTSCAAARQDPLPLLPLYTDTERAAIRTYWNAAGRYTVASAPDVPRRLNVTIEGSTWCWNFNKACAERRKTAPQDATAWQDWWNRRVACDRASTVDITPRPANPGPPPPALIAAVGSTPPALYETVQPMRYTVTFAPEDAASPFVYDDGIDFAKRSAYYPYYRSRTGVIRAGKRVKDLTGDDRKRVESLFARAGRSDFERRVLQAVSSYEGGFEAINTYDTGFVSVGFLQFITAVDGTGSLAEVLLRYKTDDPAGFARDFRRFGIEVAPSGVLVCVDPATGAELRGADAVRRVIDDKRLTAVFERAAAGDGFRLAQVAVARDHYWPGEEVLVVTVKDNTVLTTALLPASGAAMLPPPLPDTTVAFCPLSDIIHSEAGMATLMDRKVNRGNIREIAEIAQRVLREKNLTDPRALAAYERTLTSAMKFRGDFLADTTLSQPPPELTATPGATSFAPSPTPAPRKRRR